jgi:hypothetical protein
MVKSHKHSLTSIAVEVLTTLVLFNAFVTWTRYAGIAAHLLGLFLCLFALNEWLTTRSSHAIYTDVHLVLDVSTAFLLANAPALLLNTTGRWGYSPFFWLDLAIIEGLYAGWDVARVRRAQKGGKSIGAGELIRAIGSSLLCGGLFLVLGMPVSLLMGHVCAGVVVALLLTNMIWWNIQRASVSKSALDSEERTAFID